MKQLNISSFFTLLILFLCVTTISAQKVDHILDEALIQLEEGTDLDAFQRDIRIFNGKNSKARIIRHISKKMNVFQVQFDHGVVNEHHFRDFMWRHPAVKVVQVNHILSKRETIPDDPEFGTQWHWVNTGQSGGTADADIDMDLAWDITTGGTTANGDEIVVAVFDDGGDLDHPDLIANNWVNTHEIAGNGIDDDNNGYIDDINGWNYAGNNNNVDGGGHGVNVAGMIGGVGNNGNQGTGVNWNIKIMNNRTGGIQEAQVIEFYSYALDQRQRYNESNGADGAFVVATNSSWGIDGGDPNNAPLWCAFYDSLGVVGILSCGATANNNVNIDVVGDLPTACPSEYMVAVTATNDSDNRTFSAYGATTIDVGAPGADIYTTAQGGGYTFTSGTSFASPTTAGVIGLMYSAPCSNIASLAISDPALAAQNIRDYLYEGSENVGNLEGDVVYGRINAFNSIQLIMDNCGPCPPPSGLNVTDLVDVEGNLVWNNPPDGQSNTMRYRETGAMDWVDVADVSSPYLLTGLTACTEYEFQIEAQCTDTLSGHSNSFVFTTDGCCVAPETLSLMDADSNSVVANWSFVFAAQSYNVRIRAIGATDWTAINTTDLTNTFEGLEICTDYEVQVQTVCANETTEYTESQFFSTFGCGACIDLTYCDAGGEDVSEEYISNFEINTLLNSTPDQPDNGYSDFTGSMMTTTFETYASYTFTVTPTFPGASFNEHYRIFIDYNQDGDFEDADEMAFDADDVSQNAVTGSITIPETASFGLTRMRLIQRFNNPANPCGSYNFGETEDYCITIVEGTPVCNTPGSLTASSIMETTATLNWESVSLAASYVINYRAIGAPDWIQTTSAMNFVAVDNLLECTEYEFQVASECPNIGLSDFSETSEFLTICACPIPGGLDTMNVAFETATLLWDAVDNADSYELQYKLLTSTTWIDQIVMATSINLNGLMDCSDYEYQVRTICQNSESAWSESFVFSMECIVSNNEIENGVDDLEIQPNPFNDQLFVKFNLSEGRDITINIFNSTGQLISAEKHRPGSGESNLTINDLGAMSSGVYFIAITTNIGTKVRKVIKQ